MLSVVLRCSAIPGLISVHLLDAAVPPPSAEHRATTPYIWCPSPSWCGLGDRRLTLGRYRQSERESRNLRRSSLAVAKDPLVRKKKKKEKDRESLDPQMPDTLCPRFTCRCPYSVRRASPRAEVPSAAQPLPPTGCHCPSMPACSGTRRPTVCADPARQYLLDVRVQLRALVQSSPSAPRDRHQAAHGGIVI